MTPSIRRRWPWFLLVGSLAVNMLAGGAAVAFMLHPPPPPGPDGMLRHFIDRVGETLPPEDKAILTRVANEARPLLVRMHAGHDDFRAQLQAELIAVPFDPDRVKALFDARRTSDDALRAEIDARAVDALRRFSPEARLRLAETRFP